MSLNIHAQINPDSDTAKTNMDDDLRNYYLQKSKDQRNGAFVLLPVGITLNIVGLTFLMNEYIDEGSASSLPIVLVGIASTITGIGLFISSANNKNKAELLLTDHTIPLNINPNKNTSFKSIGIGFKIGR